MSSTLAGEAAAEAARRAGVEVRELDTPAGTAAAAALFAAIWPGGATPVSADLMRALHHAGNYVAGAYVGERMVGAAMAFFTGEKPATLHSHICGVSPAMRGRNVGFALKLHQRAWALHRGIGTIMWTVDPLVRHNVYFNLAKLAATVTGYQPDFYGPMRDGVNAGDPSDRLLLTWPLGAERVAAASAGIPAVLAGTEDVHTVLSVGAHDEPVREAGSGAPTLRCALPADIVRLRRTDPPLATAWRHALRAALVTALHDGYRVAGVDSGGAFILTRSESG